MKTRGELQGARLKAEPIRDEESHDITGYDCFWLVTVKVPAHRIDANELHKMVGETIRIELSTDQLSLGLESPSVTMTVPGYDSVVLTPEIAKNCDTVLRRGRRAKAGQAGQAA